MQPEELSPLVTVEDMVADELEESLGEVVKFLDVGVLDLKPDRENVVHFFKLQSPQNI